MAMESVLENSPLSLQCMVQKGFWREWEDWTHPVYVTPLISPVWYGHTLWQSLSHLCNSLFKEPIWGISISWIPWNLSFRYILFHEKKATNDAVTPQCRSQFTPKMKANAVPRLLSSLVWIDQYNECNGMTSFMEFMFDFTECKETRNAWCSFACFFSSLVETVYSVRYNHYQGFRVRWAAFMTCKILLWCSHVDKM